MHMKLPGRRSIHVHHLLTYNRVYRAFLFAIPHSRCKKAYNIDERGMQDHSMFQSLYTIITRFT